MDKIELKILNGIYINNGLIDDGIVYYIHELNWLINNELDRALEWHKGNGQYNSTGNEISDNSDPIYDNAILNRKILKALTYLKGKHYIDFFEKGSGQYKISVTLEGCEVARKIQTTIGKVDLWYQDKKDGVIWILITVGVSIITTLITVFINNYLKSTP